MAPAAITSCTEYTKRSHMNDRLPERPLTVRSPYIPIAIVGYGRRGREAPRQQAAAGRGAQVGRRPTEGEAARLRPGDDLTPATPEQLLALQRAAGNGAVDLLLSRPPQPRKPLAVQRAGKPANLDEAI